MEDVSRLMEPEENGVTPAKESLFLVLFDISGYTDFLCSHKENFEHAEHIIARLLAAIIATIKTPLEAYEVSGDSVSFYLKSNGDAKTARAIWDQMEEVYVVFRAKEEELRRVSGRNCAQCATHPPLKLKAVLHHGEAVFNRVGRYLKIAGPDIILAHRLLKNGVQSKEYVLVTADFYFAGSMMTPMGAILQGENCQGFGEIGILVWYPPGSMPDELRPAGSRTERLGWTRS